jgi:hypothetical protein
MHEKTPVFSVSFGADMIFWIREILAGKKRGPETAAVALKEGSVWCWSTLARQGPNPSAAHLTLTLTLALALSPNPTTPTVPGDDRAFEHHVCFPRAGEQGYDPNGIRYTFVFRWVRGVREYDPLTHRNLSGNDVTNPDEFNQ